MRENYRNSIASIKKFPQFTTMNVIDGQAGLIICASLIFYSLTIDNILNIIVLLILAGVTINLAVNNQGIFNKAKTATRAFKNASENEQTGLDEADKEIAKYMPKGASEGGSGSESSGGTSEAGKVYFGNVCAYLQSDGKLYSFNCPGSSNYDKDFDLTYIRDDVKERLC